MKVDTATLSCILTPIIGIRSTTCATRGGARSEEGPQEGDDHRNSPTAPSATRTPRQGFNPTFTYHFVKRWSSYQNPAVDPARDAELMTRHTGEALRIDDRSRINRSVDPTASQSGNRTARKRTRIWNCEGRQLPGSLRRGARTVIGRAVTPWHCRVGGSNPSLSTRQELKNETG